MGDEWDTASQMLHVDSKSGPPLGGTLMKRLDKIVDGGNLRMGMRSDTRQDKGQSVPPRQTMMSTKRPDENVRSGRDVARKGDEKDRGRQKAASSSERRIDHASVPRATPSPDGGDDGGEEEFTCVYCNKELNEINFPCVCEVCSVRFVGSECCWNKEWLMCNRCAREAEMAEKKKALRKDVQEMKERMMATEGKTEKRTTLMIVSLDDDVDVQIIKAMCLGFGEIISCKMPSGKSGKHLGHAFVQFKYEEDAINAKNVLHGQQVGARKMGVMKMKEAADEGVRTDAAASVESVPEIIEQPHTTTQMQPEVENMMIDAQYNQTTEQMARLTDMLKEIQLENANFKQEMRSEIRRLSVSPAPQTDGSEGMGGRALPSTSLLHSDPGRPDTTPYGFTAEGASSRGMANGMEYGTVGNQQMAGMESGAMTQFPMQTAGMMGDGTEPGFGQQRGRSPPHQEEDLSSNMTFGQQHQGVPYDDGVKRKEADKIEIDGEPNIGNIVTWKVNNRKIIANSSTRPADCMKWVMEVERPGATLVDFADSGRYPNLDSKLSTALTLKIKGITNLMEQVQILEEQQAQSFQMLKGRQILWLIYEHFRLSDGDRRTQIMMELTLLRVASRGLTGFLVQWDLLLVRMQQKERPESSMLLTLFEAQVRDHPSMAKYIGSWDLQPPSQRTYESHHKMVTIVVSQLQRDKNKRNLKKHIDKATDAATIARQEAAAAARQTTK